MTTVALLGLGAATRRIHVPALARLPDVRVVGGADPSPAARDAFARAAGAGVVVEADATKLLQSTRPEWAVVVAPPAAHRALCESALAAGAHVFCEKPFVETVADADAVLAAAARAGRRVALNHEFPAMPIFRAVLERVRGGASGAPRLLRLWQNVLQPAEDGWRGAGRTMQEFGSHAVDLAIRVFGAAPVRVVARMPRPAGVGEGDPIDLVVLEFSGGGAATLTLNRVHHGPHRYLELGLDCERESLRASLGGRARAVLEMPPRRRFPRIRFEAGRGGMAWIEDGDRRRVLARNPGDVFVDATARHFGDVLAAVAHGREPPASGAEARRVVATVAAAYASAADGEPRALAGDAP